MQKFLFIIVIALAMPAFAQNTEWKTIYPVSDCNILPILYKDDPKGGFLVLLKGPRDIPNMTQEVHVDDLNDLSDLTEYIVEQSNEYCPSSYLEILAQVTPDDTISCGEQSFFSEDYIDFVRFTAEYVNKEGNQCENIIPFIKLQEEISQLDREELIKFKKSKKIGHLLLKILTGDETDDMINQFDACGGKKGSDKFIRNMILLEANKSCIVPNMLPWAEAEEIANKIGSEHKNINLLKLNKLTDQISYDATMAFTNRILENEVNDMLGPIFETNSKRQNISKKMNKDKGLSEKEKSLVTDSKKFINELNSKQRLDNYSNKKDIADYVGYVFSVDAAMEIGEKAVPLFIESSFYDKLPTDWSEEQKKEFINNKLIKKANKRYASCMADRKEYSKYGHDFEAKKFDLTKTKERKNEDALIKYRLETKDKFCDKNKEQCIEGDCGGSINMLQMDDSATDTEVVQGCVLQSITISIEPLLEGIIYSQRESFKDDFDLTDILAEQFTKETWGHLKNCANKKIKAVLGAKTDIDITQDEAPLQKIKTTDYEKIMLECSDEAEAKVSRRFVDQVLINQETLQRAYGDKDIVDKWDASDKHYQNLIDQATSDVEKLRIQKEWELTNQVYADQLKEDQAVKKISQEVIKSSFDLCMDKQTKLAKQGYDPLDPQHGLVKKNTMLCSPIIEMAASLKVVETSLEDLLKDENLLEDLESLNVLSRFKTCGQESLNGAVNDIGSLTSETPLNTNKQSKTYLDNNPAMFGCVESAIGDLSYVIAGKSIDDQIEKQKGKIHDINYFKSLKEETQIIVKQCFTNGISQQKNWTGFTKFSDEDGLDKLKDRCELEASKFVISKLVMNESFIEMKPLIEDGFLEDKGDIYDIRAMVAFELRSEYGIPTKDGVELVSYSYGEAMQLHINQGGTQDTFLDLISKKIETQAIERVHKNLNQSIWDKSTNINERAKFSSLPEYFPASCLQDIYNRFIKNASKSEGDPVTLDKLSGYLQTGLSFAHNKSPVKFWDEMKLLKSQCDNIDQFKNEKDFNKSQFYSLILKGQIYQEFKTEFKKGIMDSLAEQEKNLTEPHKWIKQKYMTDMKTRMNDLLDIYLKEAAFNNAIFNDNQVMNFATDNLDKLLSDDPKIKKGLSNLLISKMFDKIGDNTFADQFTQIQIEGNFGIDGVSEAYDEASKGKSILWGMISVGKGSGKSAATKYFANKDNIKNVIDWKNIDEDTRKIMTKSIFHDAIAESQYDRAEEIDEYDVYAVVAKSDQFSNKIFIGRPAFEKRIGKITDNVTNGYKNYNDNVEAEAKKYANEIFNSNPNAKKKMSKKELTDHIIKEVKARHMERNVTNMLLYHKDKKGKSVKDKITDEIESKASDIFWGNTPEAEKARQKRQWEKATNPWPVGSKI